MRRSSSPRRSGFSFVPILCAAAIANSACASQSTQLRMDAAAPVTLDIHRCATSQAGLGWLGVATAALGGAAGGWILSLEPTRDMGAGAIRGFAGLEFGLGAIAAGIAVYAFTHDRCAASVLEADQSIAAGAGRVHRLAAGATIQVTPKAPTSVMLGEPVGMPVTLRWKTGSGGDAAAVGTLTLLPRQHPLRLHLGADVLERLGQGGSADVRVYQTLRGSGGWLRLQGIAPK